MDEESIPAPPYAAYRSYDEAYTALKEHGIRYGYGFHITTSRPSGSATKTRVYFGCDKGGEYRSRARIRSTGTRTSGCRFKLVIYQKDNQWMLRVTFNQHNHGPSLHPSAHHVYRRRTAAQKEMITSLSNAGVTPNEIFAAIREADPTSFISPRDIRNEISSANTDDLGGRSAVEAPLDEQSTPDRIFDITLEPGRNGTSTRRTPSQFEHSVPPTYLQLPQSLTDRLRELDNTPQHPITVYVPLSITLSAPVSAPISINVSITLSPSPQNGEPASQRAS
jgi:hypothetical protein